MSEISSTRRIQAPVETVFAAATDLDQWADRISAIDRIERLTDGPVGNGTRFRETRTMFGKQATEEMEIADFRPNESYALLANSCGNRYRTTWTFVPDGDATDLTFHMTATPETLPAKILALPLSFLMKGMMRKCIEKDLEDLAASVEGGAAAPATT